MVGHENHYLSRHRNKFVVAVIASLNEQDPSVTTYNQNHHLLHRWSGTSIKKSHYEITIKPSLIQPLIVCLFSLFLCSALSSSPSRLIWATPLHYRSIYISISSTARIFREFSSLSMKGNNYGKGTK